MLPPEEFLQSHVSSFSFGVVLGSFEKIIKLCRSKAREGDTETIAQRSIYIDAFARIIIVMIPVLWRGLEESVYGGIYIAVTVTAIELLYEMRA